MAVVSLAPISYADSDAAALLIAPIYLGGDTAADSAAWAMLGANVTVLGFLAAAEESVASLDVALIPTLLIVMEADSDVVLAITTPEPTIAAIDGVSNADSEVLLALAQEHALTIVATGDGDAALVIGDAALPLVPGGTVNVIRNPSAEIDLTDWSASDAVLDRVGGDAWVGDWYVEATIEDTAAAGSDPTVTVLSVRQLGANAGPASQWLGAVMLRGDAVLSGLTLRAVYDDTTSDDAESTVDATEPVTLGAEWTAFATNSPDLDPARRLDSLSIIVTFARQVAATICEADGAMIVDATETGTLPPYVDGDQGEGTDWFGAAHASVSYREAAA